MRNVEYYNNLRDLHDTLIFTAAIQITVSTFNYMDYSNRTAMIPVILTRKIAKSKLLLNNFCASVVFLRPFNRIKKISLLSVHNKRFSGINLPLRGTG